MKYVSSFMTGVLSTAILFLAGGAVTNLSEIDRFELACTSEADRTIALVMDTTTGETRIVLDTYDQEDQLGKPFANTAVISPKAKQD